MLLQIRNKWVNIENIEKNALNKKWLHKEAMILWLFIFNSYHLKTFTE